MASLSSDKKGNRTIQFTSADKKRRTIRLGKIPKKTAQEIKLKVEALNFAQRSQTSVEPAVADWVRVLSPWLYDKLANVKLLPKRQAPEHVELELFLDQYIARRTDIKPGTKTVLMQTKRCLVAFFGPEKHLDEITLADADEWRRYLSRPKSEGGISTQGQGLGENTVRKRCCIAKQFFRYALRRRLIDESPFADMKNTSFQQNRDKFYYISKEEAEKVLSVIRKLEWRVIFCLARYGGLRIPSELLLLKWSDIDFESGKITIHSPKTEHHGKEHSFRIIPLYDELRPSLAELRSSVNPGIDVSLDSLVITQCGTSEANLRTQLNRYIVRAKMLPWPKPFINLRSTRQTELSGMNLPAYVVCEWMGNSEKVADKHYLQVTEAHFDIAREALHFPTQHTAPLACTEQHGVRRDSSNPGKYDNSQSIKNNQLVREGFEPPTKGL